MEKSKKARGRDTELKLDQSSKKSLSHIKKKRFTVKFLQDCELNDIMFCMPMDQKVASIDVNENLWVAISMLQRFSKTMNDNLVVIKDDLPKGLIGAKELIQKIRQAPTYDTLSRHIVGEIAKGILSYNIFDGTMNLIKLLKHWQTIRRGFAIIRVQNKFIPFSSRMLLCVGTLLEDKIKTSDLVTNKIITFDKKNTVGEIIDLMFDNKIRRLVLENSNSFISDRGIIEQIIALDYLKNTKNFLTMKSNVIKTDPCPIFTKDASISKVCKLMSTMIQPCAIIKDRMFTPWDLISIIS